MLHTSYSCHGGAILPRYLNDRHRYYGEVRCIAFGGLWVDEAVAKEVLHAIGGNGVEAALEAAEQMRQRRQELRKAMEFEVEQARYEAVDTDQRLVAAELEARWNAALQKVRDAEQRLEKFDLGTEGTVCRTKICF